MPPRRPKTQRPTNTVPAEDDLDKIRLICGPLDDPQEIEAAEKLWIVIGRAACAWARLEQHIDFVLFHLNQKKHSERLWDSEHPISFTKKIKLLKLWFNRHPPLAEYQKTIRELSSHLKELGKARNIFLHSILDDFDPESERVTFRSVRPKEPGAVAIHKDVGGIDQLLEFLKRVHEAHVTLREISVRLWRSSVAEQP
jgi:hypothetical protein